LKEDKTISTEKEIPIFVTSMQALVKSWLSFITLGGAVVRVIFNIWQVIFKRIQCN
jgi:hypothetical protein